MEVLQKLIIENMGQHAFYQINWENCTIILVPFFKV